MNRNRNNQNDRFVEESYRNQPNWQGGQNAFARNETAWNRGNVDSPEGWGQSYGANYGLGAPGRAYEGSDYERENRARNYADYRDRGRDRGFFNRAGHLIREGLDRAGDAVREGWDRVTNRNDPI
jgi:hypothetical protein